MKQNNFKKAVEHNILDIPVISTVISGYKAAIPIIRTPQYNKFDDILIGMHTEITAKQANAGYFGINVDNTKADILKG